MDGCSSQTHLLAGRRFLGEHAIRLAGWRIRKDLPVQRVCILLRLSRAWVPCRVQAHFGPCIGGSNGKALLSSDLHEKVVRAVIVRTDMNDEVYTISFDSVVRTQLSDICLFTCVAIHSPLHHTPSILQTYYKQIASQTDRQTGRVSALTP
jgi:hypothetical protein